MFQPSLVVPLFLSAGILAAQHSPMSGPVEAYVFDAPTRSFRAASGVLGSASLGPVLLGEFQFGSVAPRQNFAIAYQSGQCLFVSGLGSKQQAAETISDACVLPEAVAWSGDGTVAVLHSRTENALQIVTGLSGQVAVGPPISVSPLGGSLSAVSLDLNGAHIYAGVAGGSGGVYEVQSDLSLVPVLSLVEPIALVVDDERHILYALDRAGNQLHEMSLTDLTSQSWALSELQDPVSLLPARDTQQRQIVYVAGRADQLLVAYDAVSHEVIASLPLDFAPGVVEAFGRHSFVLRRRISDDDPLWSFSDAAEPTAYFIPASPLSDAGGLQ